MTTENRTEHRHEDDHLREAREKILAAALLHVPFDGWSPQTVRAATIDSEVDPGLARLAFPRGGIDLALEFHRSADRELATEMTPETLEAMRIRERITHCVRRRIELVADHREAVRRGAALFALPIHAGEGAKAIWSTADLIWTLCGDTATDYNWYTKRAILTSVYSSTVLFWLGDDDPRAHGTWEFLDRRIENVMQIEKTKASLRKNPLARAVFWGPKQVLNAMRAPGTGGYRPAHDGPDRA